MHEQQQHTSTLPVICLLVAATLWGVFWYPLRILEGQGLGGIWASLFIYIGTLVIAVPVLIRRFRELLISPSLLLAIMICSGWCNISFILAILEGEVVRVILLFYLSPIWATILSRFVLKEELTLMARMLIVLAMGGAMTMLWTPEFGYPWPVSIADWLALSSGVAFALTNLFVHMAKNISIQVKTSTAWVGVVLVAGLIILIQGKPLTVANMNTIYLALLIGLFLMTLMTFCVVFGVTHMPVHRSAVILIFEIVAATISAYLLTDERLNAQEWIGGIIVIIAAYLAAMQHKRKRVFL
ncbi:MAG: DMT family transporter [Thioalkalispiraceae bacterium]|jgi:drug/metabolite transporter (DMT)-like permease